MRCSTRHRAAPARTALTWVCACRVYHEDWETFAREAEKLYTEHPSHVRLPACAHSSYCVDQAIGCTDVLRDEIPAQRREDGSEGHK